MLIKTRLGYMVKALDKITDQALFENAIDKAVLDEVARLNREQLSKGKRADGSPIKHYSVQFGGYSDQYADMSVAERSKKGRQTDYIDLNFTGEFYESITAILLVDEILITAETQKEDTNLIDEYGEAILGISKENLDIIRDMVKNRYIAYIRKALGID